MGRAAEMNADNTPGVPHARSTVSTAELLVIPADMVGRFCWFQSVAGSGSAVDVAIRFGTSAGMGAVVIGDRSTIDGSGNLTADVNAPHLYIVASAAPQRVKLDPSWTHISHLSSGTTGCLRFGPATGQG